MSDRLLLGASLIGILLSSTVLLRAQLAQRRQREEALHRFREIVGIEAGQKTRRHKPRRVELVRILRRRLRTAGIELTETQIWIGAPAFIIVALLTWIVGGAAAAAILVVLVLACTQFLVLMRAAHRRRLMLEQLPSFLEQVVRMISAGTSLAVAIQEASREMPDPLGQLLAQLERQLELGVSLDEALDRLTEGVSLRELDLVALAIRVHHRHGGSVVDLLTGVTRTVRERDRLQREFRAMTAETRTSALILGLLPLALALYVMLFNPGYLGFMWTDDTGRRLLVTAAVLQVTGATLLWRMVRAA